MNRIFFCCDRGRPFVPRVDDSHRQRFTGSNTNHSRTVQTNLQSLSPTQFTFSIPAYPSFSHIVVFLLPGQVLPEGTAAGVYIRFPPSLLRRRRRKQTQAQSQSQGIANTSVASTSIQNDPNTSTQEEEGFKFLGAIANEKQSAIFRVRLPEDHISSAGSGVGIEGVLEDEDAMVDEGEPSLQSRDPGSTSQGVAGTIGTEALNTEENIITLGISIEPVENISAQVATLQQQKPSTTSVALIPANPAGQTQPPSSPAMQGQYELRLARKIITHAFNFLASFAVNVSIPSTGSIASDPRPMGQFGQQQGFGGPGPGGGGGGGGGVMEEVVPLRAFHDWWNKFQKKMELDPTFLNREE